ncbi:hypothetical protein [Streptomyces sp. H27-C3]|uniref:hypothetical protein n=1 Tax=Streptomyces sp. H27-C3 TaxID=3046305 RepID=UPI0024BBB2E1|nr:hypothetical protein [Streptomyces sp. H27-C3]MDJ0463161.1 hypothetical protein [Streptomyces sp. H27-C3]
MARTAAFDEDEEFDTRPKRRRSLDENDESEARPKRRRSLDDGEEESRPKRRRSLDDEDDEEPRTRKRGRPAPDEEADEESRPKRSRRTRADEDEDEDEERPSRANAAAARRNAASGWDEFDNATSGGNNTDFEAKKELKLQVTNKQQLLKVLNSAPFDSMGLHYIQEIKTGKRSFRCGGEKCPLCDDLDHYARKLAYFNIALFNEDTDQWENRVWEVGVKVGRKLKAINDDKKRGPLDKDSLYFSISKTGKGTNTEYHLETVKARDLDEDWDIDEVDDKTLKTLNDALYTEPWERFSNPQELKRVVNRLLDDDGDEDGY